MDLKKEAVKLKNLKGNIRGEGLLTDIRYVHFKKGDKGVKMLESKLNELGYKIKFDEIKSLEWYPIKIDVLKNLILMDIFKWTEKDIFEMGNFAPKVSFLVKVLIKYFVSAKKSFSQSPKYWKQHFDIGELEPYNFSAKEKKMVFRLRDFNVHPVMCTIFSGYFLRIAQFVLKSDKITIEETVCTFKKGSYHEYLIKWK